MIKRITKKQQQEQFWDNYWAEQSKLFVREYHDYLNKLEKAKPSKLN